MLQKKGANLVTLPPFVRRGVVPSRLKLVAPPPPPPSPSPCLVYANWPTLNHKGILPLPSILVARAGKREEKREWLKGE